MLVPLPCLVSIGGFQPIPTGIQETIYRYTREWSKDCNAKWILSNQLVASTQVSNHRHHLTTMQVPENIGKYFLQSNVILRQRTWGKQFTFSWLPPERMTTEGKWSGQKTKMQRLNELQLMTIMLLNIKQQDAH